MNKTKRRREARTKMQQQYGDHRQSPAHRLVNLLNHMRQNYYFRYVRPKVAAADQEGKGTSTTSSSSGDAAQSFRTLFSPTSRQEQDGSVNTADVYVQQLRFAYQRLGLDQKAQGVIEQSRGWVQACLWFGNCAPQIWGLSEEEEFALLQLLECNLQARMDGELTMEEMTLSPQEQVARLLEWRRCALSMCEMKNDEEQRCSSVWKRFGAELVNALETGRSRDTWKFQSPRWLAVVSDLVRFAEQHVHLLWRSEINGFAFLALLRSSPHRLAPALAHALPTLHSSLTRKYVCKYERSVVAILRSGHTAAIEEISHKVLEGDGVAPLRPDRRGHRWMLRVQTHLVRFACTAGTKVLRAWLELEDSLLWASVTVRETQHLLKQVLSTNTSTSYPELYAAQKLLAQKLLSLAPPNSEARQRLLGQGNTLSRLELLLAKSIGALLSPDAELEEKKVEEQEEDGTDAQQFARPPPSSSSPSLSPQKTSQLRQQLQRISLKLSREETQQEAATSTPLFNLPEWSRIELLEVVVSRGLFIPELSSMIYLLPEDPCEEPGPSSV